MENCNQCTPKKICAKCYREQNPTACSFLERRGCRLLAKNVNEICERCKNTKNKGNEKQKMKTQIKNEENKKNSDVNDLTRCKYCKEMLKGKNKSGDNSHNLCFKKDCDEKGFIVCNGLEHYGCRCLLINGTWSLNEEIKGIIKRNIYGDYINYCNECYNHKTSLTNEKKMDDCCVNYINCKGNKFTRASNLLCLKCLKKDPEICSNIEKNSECLIKVDDANYKRCSNCRQKERANDNARNEIRRKMNEINKNSCSSCGKEKPENEFIGVNGNITKTCSLCRFENKKADDKRKNDINRILYKREQEQKPHIIETRKRWRMNNKEKVDTYWKKCRENKRLVDECGYLKHNADIMQKYRDNHPDKFGEIYAKQKTDTKYRLKYYKYSAEKRKIKYNVDDAVMIELFNGDCIYCGRKIDDVEINGVDRIDNKIGYVEENIVSCCKMCNYMKCDLDMYTFIKKCEHIATHKKLKNFCLHPLEFSNYKGTSLSQYMQRAKNKNLEFDLTESIFEIYINGCCYICGKKTNKNHTNGIDRVDNKKGYFFENCETCCGDCNYMKKSYSHNEFLEKIVKICENMKNYMTLNGGENLNNKIKNDTPKEIDTHNDVENPKHDKNAEKTCDLKKIDKVETITPISCYEDIFIDYIDFKEYEDDIKLFHKLTTLEKSEIGNTKNNRIKYENYRLSTLRDVYVNNFNRLEILTNSSIVTSIIECDNIDFWKKIHDEYFKRYKKVRKDETKKIEKNEFIEKKNNAKDIINILNTDGNIFGFKGLKLLFRQKLLTRLNVIISENTYEQLIILNTKLGKDCSEFVKKLEEVKKKHDMHNKEIEKFLKNVKIFHPEKKIFEMNYKLCRGLS